MVRGGFNLNSQSVEAWRALLDPGDMDDFHFTSDTGRRTGPMPLDTPYFNRAFTGEEALRGRTFHYQRPSRTSNFARRVITDPDHPAYIQGFRELTPDLAGDLAAAIVAQSRTETIDMGRPFYSLTELINSGVVQKAIDSVGGINRPAGRRIPRGSPAYFGQNTLFGKISPYSFVRSDTFRIRAYGETTDPVTGEVTGSALCEAVIQRVPDPVGSGPNTVTSRELQLVAFRWIEDISE